MTTLPDSGRSKLDVEVSYSSSTNNPDEGLSTAEFVHVQQQQQPQQMDGQRLGYRPQNRQASSSYSTRLTNVPVSVDFDLSVFATKDQHGRLTLYPVLRATTGESITSAAVGLGLGQSSPPIPPTQPVTVAGDVAGVRGRNNCARAAVAVSAQQAHPLAEADLGSRRQAHVGIHPAFANHQIGSTQPIQQQPQLQPRLSMTFRHGQAALQNADERSTGCSSSSNSSSSSRGEISYQARQRPAELPGERSSTRRTVQSVGSRGTQVPDRHRRTPHGSQQDCHTCTMLPRFPIPTGERSDCCIATVGTTKNSNATRPARQSGRHQRCSILSRFVHKLEALVDIMLDEEAYQTQRRQRCHRRYPPSTQAQMAVASPASSVVQLLASTVASSTASATPALAADAAAAAPIVTVAAQQSQRHQPVVVSALPRSNVALPDLKLEYAQLYQRD